MTDTWERQVPACKGYDPEWWFPHAGDLHSDSTNEARRICITCPIRQDCGLHAANVGERWGIRAGYYLPDATEFNALREFHGLSRVRTPRRCEECGERLTNGECTDCLNGGVPAGPPREHVERLRAMRVSLTEIARDAGVPLADLRALRTTTTPRVPRRTADRILSVPIPDGPRGCSVCGRTNTTRLTRGLCSACYKRPDNATPLVLVDASPTREHIRQLQSAMALREISQRAGVTRSVVDDLLYGKTRSAGIKSEVRRIRAVTADAILAIPVPQGVSA